MSLFSKVAWREGLFLQQQHLQQSDRYLEHLIDARLAELTPYPWGIAEMAIDRDLAQQGKIGLRKVRGIMPDGLPFDAPAACALPVPAACPDDAAGQSVWLTLPEASANGRDIGPDDEGATMRYRLLAESVADNAAEGRQEQLIEVAEPRLELVVRKTPRPGYQCLRIARISEVRNGVIAFDETTPPPALIIAAHPVLLGFLSRVIGWVEARLETLSRYASDPSSGGGLQATDYLQLMVLNREITVLRHLASNWSPQPPQREHPRHPVKTRISVLQGFDDCFTLFSGDVARLGKERTAESWVVEDVSLGGFRARVEVLADWLKIGALMSLQPEGGENWVLGVVRRFSKDAEGQAHVGIKALSRQAKSVELRPRSSGFSATGAIPGIRLLEDDNHGELRLAMPLESFDVRESLEFIDGGKRYLLSPIELEGSGSNYEIGRYRQQAE